MPSVSCHSCQKEFHRPPSMVYERTFCSNGCRMDWLVAENRTRRSRVDLSCTHCGRPFDRQPSWVWPTGNNFCTRDCQAQWHSHQMRGAANPQHGVAHAEKTKEKIRRKQLGKKYTPETNIKKGRAGVLNPFYGRTHSAETRRKLSMQARERMSDPDFKTRLFEKIAASQRRKPNKAEVQLLDLLNKQFPGEWKYVGDGSLIINGLNPDFVNINGKKNLIELFGTYWHRDVKKRSWNYTEPGRVAAFKQMGFRCLVIWDKELSDKERLVRKLLTWYRFKS